MKQGELSSAASIKEDILRRIQAVINVHGHNQEMLCRACAEHFEELQPILVNQVKLGVAPDVIQYTVLYCSDVWWEEADLPSDFVDDIEDQILEMIKDNYVDDFVIGE